MGFGVWIFDLRRDYHVRVAGKEVAERPQRLLRPALWAQVREVIMLKLRRRSGMYLLSFAAVLAVAGAPDASAQQKLTYEQAFARCKADVVRNTPGETVGSAARYSRGLACMSQYGFRLKEGAKF
jgi:hypothetical protein